MSHPDGLPDLFLDRSLGRKKVPGLLRAGGLRLVTLAEHYGIPADETVSDEAWLEFVGTRGWVALMKDDRIRYITAERQALQEHQVMAFVLTNANLPAADMAARFVAHVDTMAEICRTRRGPFLFAVHARRVVEVSLT